MPNITFLSADMPLTKSFSLVNGELVKTPYPHAFLFTSHTEDFSDLRSLLPVLRSHASHGHCLLKGNVQKPLVNESRAGSTDRDAETDWVCLDLDKAPWTSPDAALEAIGFSDVTYIVQYSSSHGIVDSPGLSCHIFIQLSGLIRAQLLKCWLMNINLLHCANGLTLNKTGSTLHWPIDVTACQNDKLLYIANAILGKGVKNKFKGERIQLVERKFAKLDTGRMSFRTHEELNKSARGVLNELRKAAGLEIIRAKTKYVKGVEVQPGVGLMTETGRKEDRGFVYFNFNHGDSWGYYHPVDNFEIIHNFKGEPAYLTKEILPGYYEDCKRAAKKAAQTPTEEGELRLAFRDFKSAAYWNGTWNEKTQNLEMAVARGKEQVIDWMASFGYDLGEFVPIWRIEFDPHSNYVVDVEHKRVNLYVPSEHMARAHPKRKLPPKRIHSVFESAVGTGDVLEHMYNWLAVLFQYRIKIGTAWILMGEPGTGKGLICKILKEALGDKYVAQKRMSELQSEFNSWMECALVGVIDEAQIGRLKNSDTVSSDLKNFITENTVTIRRMFQSAYETRSYINLILNSNMNEPERLQHGDRRYNVSSFQTVPLPKLSDDDYDLLMSEVGEFVDYLMTREADVKKARTVLQTESRDALIDASRTSIEAVSRALVEGDLPQMWEAITAIHDAMSVAATYAAAFKTLMESIVLSPEEIDRLTRDQLIMIYQHCLGKEIATSPYKFTATVKHHRIVLKPIRFAKEGVQQGIYVEWKYTPEWIEERRAEIAARSKPKAKVIPMPTKKEVTK